MKIDRDKIKSFGGLVLHGGISCIAEFLAGGAVAGMPGAGMIAAKVAGNIATNLAANHTAVFANLTYDKLVDRLNKPNPDDVNHDLERLFRQSGVVALEFIKKLFLAEIKKEAYLAELNRRDKEEVEQLLTEFFDETIKDLRSVTKDSKEPLDKHQLQDPSDFLTKITDTIFKISSYSFDEGTTKKLKDFYTERLPYCFDLAFKEALKKDDAGFKAFQVWMLEEMRDNHIEILNGQKRIEELIKNIQAGASLLSHEALDKILDDAAERIYALLEQDFRNIRQDLIELTTHIDKQFAAQYALAQKHLVVTIGIDKKVDALHDKVDKLTGASAYPHHLAYPLPLNPDVFIGRDEDVAEIKKRLFEGNHLLLLVNGEGGMGKTTLAAKYYHTYADDYCHVAWVLKEQSIGEAVLHLADALKINTDDSATTEERVSEVFARMAELPRPCLLVIDNANEPEDLGEYYARLMACSNFHILLTTRVTEFEQLKSYKVEGLPEDKALELFREYYPGHNAAEDPVFTAIWEATGRNTLLIELLAKNLKLLNEDEMRYGMAQLLEDLQGKGLLAIESGEVGTLYQGKGKLRKEKPERIIEAMYDIGGLGEDEVRVLSAFAVLPAENIAYAKLKILLGDAAEKLRQLYNKGWLAKTNAEGKAYYKVSPVVQEITRKKNEGLSSGIAPVIDSLIDLLEYEPGTGHFINCSYADATVYARYAESVLSHIQTVDRSLRVIAERVASYHSTTGNLPRALQYFDRYAQIAKGLCDIGGTNSDFKNGLAISYEKLGVTYSSLGDLGKALEYFELRSAIGKELHASYPDNVSFKNGLAISYEKLGSTYSSLGDLDKALEYFELYADLRKELHSSYPENVSFKNGLAISYEKLGDTYSSLGELGKALEYFEAETVLIKELHASYPENVSFKNGLAISYSKLGSTYSSLGELSKALEYFEAETVLFKELHAGYPENVSFKNGLAISYEKLGETYSSLGELGKALEYFEAATVLFKELHSGYPDNVSFKNGLAISYEKLGFTYSSLGDLGKALEYYQKDAQISEELHAGYPENVSFKNGLAISYEKLGETYSSLGDLGKALEYFEQRSAIGKELYASYPENVSFKNGLAISYEKLGETYSSLADLGKALEYYQEDAQISEELHASYPDNVSFKNGLAISYIKLAEVYELSDIEKARQHYEMAREIWEEMHERFPAYAEFKHNLDWVNGKLSEMS